MKVAPSSSDRIRVISSINEGLLRNHQHPKTIRLLNLGGHGQFVLVSRDSIVTKKRLSRKGPAQMDHGLDVRLGQHSPASRQGRIGMCRREPIIMAKGRPRLGADRQHDLFHTAVARQPVQAVPRRVTKFRRQS